MIDLTDITNDSHEIGQLTNNLKEKSEVITITNNKPKSEVITNNKQKNEVITNNKPKDEAITNNKQKNEAITNNKPKKEKKNSVVELSEDSIKTAQNRMSVIDSELEEIENTFRMLTERQNNLLYEKNKLKEEIKEAQMAKQSVIHDWSGEFKWSKQILDIKKDNFKIKDDFRKNQREVINCTLSKRDCFVVMPTGGGKSLCYQLPAVVSNGITLVVSPLISLITDQVRGLTLLNIPAVALTSHTPKDQITQIMAAIVSPKSSLKLVYVTPEKIAKSKRFLSKLEATYKNNRLARIVIDEAHCCSQWGHDYRPDYKALNILKRLFPSVPLIALTATATERVLTDVKKILGMFVCDVFRSSCNRPNLFYEVRPKLASTKKVSNDIYEFIQDNYPRSSGIIYCFSKNEADSLAEELSAKGLSVAPYHAGMKDEARDRVHQRWITDKLKIVVATIAFGLGINKLDVRFVIHHTLSKSIENYYQESGRAGRDGQKAHCILYYRAVDVGRMSSLVFTSENYKENKKHFYNTIRYCETTKCRRSCIAAFFGESLTPTDCNQSCDNCHSGLNNFVEKDITLEAKSVVNIMSQLGKSKKDKVTLLQLVDIMKGKTKPGFLFDVDSFKEYTKLDCERIVVQLLLDEVLEEDPHAGAYNVVCYLKKGYNATLISKGLRKIVMEFYKEEINSTKSKKTKTKEISETTEKSSRKRKRETEDSNKGKSKKKVKTSKSKVKICKRTTEDDDPDFEPPNMKNSYTVKLRNNNVTIDPEEIESDDLIDFVKYESDDMVSDVEDNDVPQPKKRKTNTKELSPHIDKTIKNETKENKPKLEKKQQKTNKSKQVFVDLSMDEDDAFM